MARGLWVSPTEFVSFAEPDKTLTEQIASRSRSIDFFGLGMYLPNPDPILKSQGRDIRIYRELRTDPGRWLYPQTQGGSQITGTWSGTCQRPGAGVQLYPGYAG